MRGSEIVFKCFTATPADSPVARSVRRQSPVDRNTFSNVCKIDPMEHKKWISFKLFELFHYKATLLLAACDKHLSHTCMQMRENEDG